MKHYPIFESRLHYVMDDGVPMPKAAGRHQRPRGDPEVVRANTVGIWRIVSGITEIPSLKGRDVFATNPFDKSGHIYRGPPSEWSYKPLYFLRSPNYHTVVAVYTTHESRDPITSSDYFSEEAILNVLEGVYLYNLLYGEETYDMKDIMMARAMLETAGGNASKISVPELRKLAARLFGE